MTCGAEGSTIKEKVTARFRHRLHVCTHPAFEQGRIFNGAFVRWVFGDSCWSSGSCFLQTCWENSGSDPVLCESFYRRIMWHPRTAITDTTSLLTFENSEKVLFAENRRPDGIHVAVCVSLPHCACRQCVRREATVTALCQRQQTFLVGWPSALLLPAHTSSQLFD